MIRTIHGYKVKIFNYLSSYGQLQSDLENVINNVIASNQTKLLELIEKAEQFDRDNDDVDFDIVKIGLFMTVKQDEKIKNKLMLDVTVDMLGNWSKIEEFKKYNCISVSHYCASSDIVYLPPPDYVEGTCGCGYAIVTGVHIYKDEAERLLRQYYLKTLKHINSN